MPDFPRTMVENVSLPRMLIGTNWFLGFSHQSPARDKMICSRSESQIADILEVFIHHGIDAIVGFIANDRMYNAVREAQQRTGKKLIIISTPGIDVNEGPEADAKNKEIFDMEAERGSTIVMPHTSSTDVMLDKRARVIRGMDRICAMIRERGMVPGLSTHEPESIIFADETHLDVATYISIYNAAGFLMAIEVDWTNHVIRNAAKPVITIKPLAAGRLHPFVGLNFSWSTLRPQDMVTVGTLTPDEAKEVIEMSLAHFERRRADIELQVTRSKQVFQKADQ